MANRPPTLATAISNTALFQTLPPATLTRLATGAAAITLPRGKYLYRRGEHCLGLYLVTSGRIMLYVGTGIARKVVELAGPGACIGLAAAVLGIPEIQTAETLGHCALLLVPRKVLLKSAANNAALGLRLVAALSREVCALSAEIEAFALHSCQKRVVNYLLQLAASDSTQACSVLLPADKFTIASRLGLTAEYFSRMLHNLIKVGAIAVHGPQITILDHGRLRDAGR